MRLIRNNVKVIIGFIIGVVLASGITVYAASYFASDIKYTDKKSVADALNELYNKTKDINETDATASDILNGKKAYTKNGLITGIYEESLNSAEIVEQKSNVNSGTTIDVEIGSLIIVSSAGGTNATNSEKVITNLQGGSKSGIGIWTCAFKATDTTVKITADNNNQFSYIVIK